MVSLPISLPAGFTIFVHEGEHVSPGQLLAKKEAIADHRIKLAQALHLPPGKAADILIKEPGDRIDPGDILAVKKKFGMTQRKIRSNIAGIVKGFDEENGELIISGITDNQEQVVVCPIAGTVQVCNNEQIVIATNDHIIQGVGGSGNTTQGIVTLLSIVKHPDLSSQQLLIELNQGIVDTVIVGRSFSRDSLIKAIGVGTAGVIATHIEPADMEYLQQRNMVVPIVLVDEKQLPTLVKQEGKHIFLDGTTSTILLLQ